MAAFRTPYHPSLSSASIGDMDRDRTATYQHQFSNFHQSPFHPTADSPPSPYSTRPFEMKQSMSDFSTTHGHDPESATIDAVVPHPNDAELDTAEQSARPGLLVRAQRLIPNSIYCRLYLLTVLVEAAVDVVIEGLLYLKMRDYYEGLSTSDKANDDLSVKRLPVYLGIFAFAQLVKKMYAHYLFYECLIKFDGFFWVGFSVQYLALVLNPNDAEYYLTIVMTPGCFIVLLVGHLAARHENKWMMISFFAGCLAALIYFSYKLFRIWSQRALPQYSGVFKSHTIFAAISIVFLLITFAWGVLVWNNFGKGLKKQMDKADHAKKQAENAGIGHKRSGTNVSSYMMNGTGPKRNNRMSIE
ncbi:hypothetical protein FRC06_000279 [Ceratobasidium sp. 370]|nr:hypothetical protein FRC06_000279 [Ceratobasidium sp. 370]